MVEAVDIKQIAIKLRTLSIDPANQPFIARRGVLPTLIGFVDGSNAEVRVIGAESMRFLSSHPDNRKLMAEEPNLVDTLCKAFNNSATEPILREVIGDILLYLSDHLSEAHRNQSLSLTQVLAFSKSQQLHDACSTPVSDKTKSFTSASSAAAPLSNSTANSNNGSSSSSSLTHKRNLVLSVPNLKTDENQQQLQKVLLSIRGTISFRVNLQQKSVALYTKTTTDKILHVLESSKFPATVLKETDAETPSSSNSNSNDKENSKQSSKSSSSSAASTNSTTTTTNINGPSSPGSPKYLRKDAIEASESEYKRSLVATSGATDSLEARIAKQKQQKQKAVEEKAGMSRFLSKISSAFW